MRLLLFFVMFAVVAYGVGHLFEHYSSWKQFQDPRTRILADANYDGSSIVLIGDSVFNSRNVDTLEQALWCRISALSGKKVFPAALYGASLDDFFLMSRLIAQEWPAGTTVFLNIAPTRFVSFSADKKFAGKSNGMRGNYIQKLSDMIQSETELSFFARIRHRLDYAFSRVFFISRNRDGVLAYIKGKVTGRKSYNTSSYHNKRWDENDNDAKNECERFMRLHQNGVANVEFTSLKAIDHVFRKKKINVVFVLTPLNKTMIKKYIPDSSRINSIYDNRHHELISFLKNNKFTYIDSYDEFDYSCMADMLHMNANGDNAIAATIVTYMKQQNLQDNVSRQFTVDVHNTDA